MSTPDGSWRVFPPGAREAEAKKIEAEALSSHAGRTEDTRLESGSIGSYKSLVYLVLLAAVVAVILVVILVL